jgi:protein regulator of cytokinesis 1
MIMPKPGTQHHALGHGRIPSSVVYGGAVGSGSYPAGIRSTTSQGYGRFPSSGYVKKGDESGMMKKATRASRESFKPRPSSDALDIGISVGVGGTRWGGGFTLKEEDEGY